MVSPGSSVPSGSEFDNFLSERDRSVLVNALQDYQATHGSWKGISQALTGRKQLDLYSRNATLADAKRMVVFSRSAYSLGQTLSDADVAESTLIEVNSQTVGYLHLPMPGGKPDGAASPEAGFFQRVGWAVAASAGIAALIALVLGGVLARTLTRPIRELTTATQAMASGKLDQRVVVRSQDEIGALAISFNQMAGELFKLRTGTQMTHIPYRGGGPAVTDVMGGQVPLLWVSIPAAAQFVKTGKLKALGVSTLKRSAAFPDVPTLQEAGVADFEVDSWYAMFVPARTPPAIIDRLNRALNSVIADTGIREKLLAQGSEGVGGTPQALAEIVAAELPKWAKLAKDANIKAD